ncbi:MAG: MFS transporter [Rhodocyclales bacterium RIFCSPLOWO2_02_FULL_63_24]|nr:MAG: MFS transporter [Rhodocyclales bacterium GWA2_65_19]OHC73143.1 MAG: MFS transporter [Rhodocyclales bacterium RIFCSPLOWO2_02_FULL_63_24]
MSAARWRSPDAVLLCGGAIVMLALGIRHGFGIFLRPMTLDLQMSRGSFAFAIALQNLVWGFAQPLAGMIADRYGAGRVLLGGGLCYAFGLALMAQSTTPWELILSAGVLIGLGLAGTYMIAIGAVGRAVAPEKRSLALGVVGAMGSFGQFVMLPFGQALISGIGWWWALLVLAANALLMLPLALPLAGVAPPPAERRQSVAAALGEALRHRGFLLVSLGFFVCGFQVVFIATHLPAYLADHGMAANAGMIALALIGLANIGGAWLAGYLGGRYSKKTLLAGLYLARAALIAAFVALPVTPASVYVFAFALGLFWLGTVPLTAGLVAQIFGVQYLSMLFGLVYLGHQIGAFLGGWLGGYAYDLTGSYHLVWLLSIALSLVAAWANFAADESELARLRPLPSAA